MADLKNYINKAQHSAIHRWILNIALNRLIPFNNPHAISIEEVGAEFLKTKLPYKRSNFNHLKGLHACSLATLAEFTMGVFLLKTIDSKQYRIIMKKLVMEYYFQGKTDAFATYAPEIEWLQQQLILPLAENKQAEITSEIAIYDANKNHLATGFATWQLKDWSLVKTKL